MIKTMYSESYYYNDKTKELNDISVVNGLENAIKDFKDGAIVECRDALIAIINAICDWENDNAVL